MKHLLLTTIAAVLLVGCGESQQSAPQAEANPAEPVAEVPAQPSSPPPEAKQIESVAEAAKPTTPPKAVSANKGADPDRGIKPEPPTAKAPDISIHEAAIDGNIEAVKQHLATGTDVNAKADDEWTPLHEAAWHGHKEIVELLIAKGADVNVKDGDGETPLGKAIRNEQTKIADLLRKRGSKTGEEVLAEESILGAVNIGDIKLVEQHLAAGADVNAKDSVRWTPLHHAAFEGYKEVAELLIAKGADVNATADTGATPLGLAYGATADLLRKHGGKTYAELKAEAK